MISLIPDRSILVLHKDNNMHFLFATVDALRLLKGMTMSVWQIKQLEKLSEKDPGLVDDMIHHLQESNPDRHEQLVIGAYLDGDINLGKAAELLGVHREELFQYFFKKGIPLRMGTDSIDALRADADAADQMGRSE